MDKLDANTIDQALLLHRSGCLQDAESIYRSILRDLPTNVDAMHLLGMLLHECDRDREALHFIKAAIHCRPEVAALHNAKAVVLMGLDRLDEAEKAVKQALTLDPALPEAFANLATVYEREGQVVEAAKALCQLLELEPHRSGILKKIASLCDTVNRSDVTMSACVIMLKQNPQSVAGHLTIGLLMASRIAPEQLVNIDLAEHDRLLRISLYHLKTAAAIEPFAETYDAWGNALLNANRHAEALEKFDLAITFNSRFSKSHEGRGRAKLELGLIEPAVADFRTAIAIESLSPIAHFELAKIERDGDHRTFLDDLTEMLASLPAFGDARHEPYALKRTRSLLHYSIAHRADKIGEHDAAFHHFVLANSTKADVSVAGETAPRVAWDRKRLDLEKRFTADSIAKSRSHCESRCPVFIVSMPRSGTTLTEQIISSHPQVHAGGELFEISDIAHTLARRLTTDTPYPACLEKLSPLVATSIASEYLDRMERKISNVERKATECGTARFTDKMPTNFWHLGLIECLFPKARIVHVQRHPLDVCVSCMKQNLTWPFSSLEDIPDYYSNYIKLMRHWTSVLTIPVHSIRYEHLVQNPEASARALIDFCELDWSEACLDPAATDHSVRTPSKWQVRQPIYQSSVESWRRYERHLQPLIDRLVENEVLDPGLQY
ncbi:Tetratricopeptide repeat-containing protein [Neorhodopirellula lusitana]|uniref:Tetratricopeptide repeat-containing protein n=1 Tax=Neorhodopirellula lusitana TaxID=445327 RepID=A0ABY1PTX2_9BACT|nr:tetratricopeptide repeat-containing sulfotransferase family protein [Neorhodopirellula lusitana]SMP46682.1 Tetratricopeptide repeat-containing protein [Neorhodopirellula lusitana]